MKNKLQKFFKSFLCVILSLAMLSTVTLNVFAEAEASKTEYIKDVKLIYAESLSEAKKNVPEGYKLLDSDLNKGTGSDNKVYFIYSTTENPDEAVTDIKMMNMKGGYVLSDYEEQLRDVKENVKNLANDVKIASEMFAVNYVKGTYGAKAAYRALSAFTVDEAGGKNLADYLLYDNPTDEFYIKFVLNAHQNILSAVISGLAMAVQGERGNTWLDRLATLDDPSAIAEQPTYWDDATTLWEHFYGFYEVYNTIDHSRYTSDLPKNPNNNEESDDGGDDAPPSLDPVDPDTQPDIENNGTEALYEVAYKTLEKYQFKTGETFNEWFLGDDVFDGEYIENFYTLLEVMTPEELAMIRLCGPLYMILATGMDEASYQDYLIRIEEVTGGEAACSIWAGVNSELFRSSIGITDEAARKIAETEFEKELNNEGDSLGMAGLKTAGFIAACGAVSLGVGLITYFGFGSLMLSCFGGTTLGAVTSAVAVGGTIFGAVALTAGIAIIVIALVVAVVFLIVWIVEIYNEKHPEYTDIPEYMYDYVEDGVGNNQFILYESVKFQDGRVADVNTWNGKEWHAMYVSHDKAAGAPIEADIIIRYGNGTIDEGYAGLSNFGNINAQNLNDYAFDDDVNGIFITYRQEDLDGDYARKDYLSHVKLFSDENAAKAKVKLLNEGYTLHEVNLTPDTDYVTYLGYKTTNHESSALTDIRLAYSYNSKQYSTGGNNASYAACGSTGDGMLTLYATRISLFGTPIRSDFLILNDRNAPAGYEPVNLFDGGPAVNLNLRDDTYIDTSKQFYLYFLPKETYTGGTQYLGGLSIAYDIPAGTKVNSLNSITKVKNIHGYEVFYTSRGEQFTEAALLYTTTYNPYRAIYNVTAVGSGGEMGNAFAQTIFYDGVGYSLVTRYIVTAYENVRYEGTTQREGDARLYVAGIYSGGKPMTPSDIYVSDKQDGAPNDDMMPVSARLSDDNRAVNLAGGFKFKWQDPNTSIGGSKIHAVKDVSVYPFYLFIRGKEYVEGNYITDIYLASKENILYGSDLDIDCGDLDNAYVVNQLAALGAHHVIYQNLNLADSSNTTYVGYSKRVKEEGSTTMLKPITNIILYYAGNTNAKLTTDDKVIDGITYKLAGDLNLLCKDGGTDSKCKRVYLYYTTNPAAGSPIMDIKIDNTPILNGWETVRTQNEKALSTDMDSYYSSMWFIHMKRTIEDPKYISEVVVGIGGNEAKAKAALVAAGCEYIVEKDLNNNVGAHSDYIYLGYKRTSDPNQAIRDLRTTHDNEVDSFVKNGVTYYKIEGNLNAYTHLFADDIFLYYTKDAKAGTPIISLGTSQHVANWTHGEGNRYVVTTVLNQHDKGSDLNANCGYQSDYIYLLITRDKQDAKGVASMIGNGSIILIVAFALLSAGAITWICIAQKKKRRIAATVSAEGTMDDIPKDSVENDKIE